ncbi:MAG: hypothetical protein M1819_006504 [Sarea resinae]|nr:MAG: hypothetical protein M1819_006504 [Sarea resinae]
MASIAELSEQVAELKRKIYEQEKDIRFMDLCLRYISFEIGLDEAAREISQWAGDSREWGFAFETLPALRIHVRSQFAKEHNEQCMAAFLQQLQDAEILSPDDIEVLKEDFKKMLDGAESLRLDSSDEEVLFGPAEATNRLSDTAGETVEERSLTSD